jgi:putative peptide zinc metalloprotease protein
MSGSETAQAVSPPDVPDTPVRATGLELIGEIQGSGYREPPALVRRADGQTIQLTPLLYLVLAASDGRRSHQEIADLVGPDVGRQVTATNVRTLCDRLRTLGVLTLADGSEPELRRSNPLLALRFRYVVSDPEATRRLTAPFARLFAPVVVALVCLAFVAVCAWVLLEKGLASATHQAFDQPWLLLAVFAITVVSAGFHEFGHAAAARYGGATPGAMGTGLYLVWPAFYTDVTDSYRLGRAGRVRTDLGGLYFNAIVAIGMFGLWWATQWDAILLIIATQVLQMLRQLAPLVRFDGYHVLADVTGVPDLYHRIKPTLMGLLPGRWKSPEASVLKPWARAVVTTWVLVVVPVLLGTLVLMVLALPRLIGTAVASLGDQADLLGEQLGDGDLLGVMVRLLSLVAIALPVLGTLYIVARTVRQVATRTWEATRGRPGRRALAGAAALAVVAGLGWAWWPEPGAYRPIQAYERGVVQDALPTSLRSATPTGLVEGRGGSAQTIWPADAELPSADSPELAVVLVPRTSGDGSAASGPEGQAAPTWVFPFNRPLPPGEGDNQALAVNTADGSTVYDVAFALVWADDDSVVNTNEAYALASCTDCQTVAVAFQVVLVVGEASVVVPQNLSGAVNYNCVECVTYALAQQLVITLPEPLDADSTARLEALWKEIAAFAASIEDVPLSELQARLSAFEAQILEVVRADTGVAPEGEPAVQPSSTAPAATPSQTSTPAATDGPTATQPSATATEQPQDEPTSTATSTATATAPATSAPTAPATETAGPTGTPTADAQTTAP